jgi:hypothetical protein
MKLVGERRALSTIVFAFFFLQYLMAVLMGGVPPELTKAFSAIAGVYGLAFFSLVAGYFWARWYSVGVGLFGVILGVVGVWKEGTEPVYMFFLITHLAAVLMLWGETMSKPYDGQTAWREKWHMDDNAVQRLGRSVIRAGVSLPFVLLYALAPKPETAMIAGLAALALTGLGMRALVQMKTWSIFALGAAGSILVAQSGAQIVGSGTTTAIIAPALAGVLLLAAAAPFVPAMFRYLRSTAARHTV